MKIFWRIVGGYVLSGLNLGITLLIINERGANQPAYTTPNWINGYFLLNALLFFPIAYLIIAEYRSKRKSKEEELNNIQKAYKIYGESFATSNFIPAYFYHGTLGGSTAAVFLLYYLVFIFSIFIVFYCLIRLIYRLIVIKLFRN